MGNFFKSSVEQKQNTNVATPTAQNILDLISKQIQGGTFGEGLGPLGREAGTSARQFVSSGGGEAFDRTQQFAGLTSLHERNKRESQAQLNENFGNIGGRFGTGLARAGAEGAAVADASFEANIGEILAQDHMQRMSRLLAGIDLLSQMELRNTQPAMQMASGGILAPDNIVHDSQFMQILEPIAMLIASINAGAGAGGGGATTE